MPTLTESASYLAKGFFMRRRVALAQIIPMRYCNLACSYCNEREDELRPVPLDEVKTWIDKLAEFKTMNITLSGGEPMKHDHFDGIIRHIREQGIMAGLITNGFYLTEKTVDRLNEAGLQDLQISIDNIQQDEISKKSLSYYEKRGTLQLLRDRAKFQVNINSVIGAEGSDPEDALKITKVAHEYGFSSTVGIIHDDMGAIRTLSGREREVYDEIIKITGRHFFQLGYQSKKFQKQLLETGKSDWKCRAGSRYLYVCEHGRVQWCSQHRVCKDRNPHGETIVSSELLDIPIEDFTWEVFDNQFNTPKYCAPDCTIQCVRLVGRFDFLRRQRGA